MNDRPRWVAVGRITRAHGVKGEVAVLPLSEVQARFEPGSTLFLEEREDRPLMITESRPHHRRLLVAFRGIEDRTSAEALRGQYLFAPTSSAPPLPEGEYWSHDLVGCDVFAPDGRAIGRLREILHTQANDVWMVVGPDGEVLIPALKEVIQGVDVASRRIVVREVPGLTAP
ncbi:MAG TPA: ribosome maturation factor RimM [Actinomycetota bacterium]|nr:ribosome maturation factor RimM [Actinomycetota bacterium]